MARYNAFSVEDDPEQAALTRQVLEKYGFAISGAGDQASALGMVQELRRPVDLVVLDRKLPGTHGGPPAVEVGDELQARLIELLPDTPFAILTGFADVDHVRSSLAGRGQIRVGGSCEPVDRVSYFRKDQSLEFDAFIAQLQSSLNAIENVEIDSTAEFIDRTGKRLLKKLALDFEGQSVTATKLAGGLSGSVVWKCEILSSNGSVRGRVISKETHAPSLPSGGIQHSISAVNAAINTGRVEGLCDGRASHVAQLADSGAESLLATLARDDVAAGDKVDSLKAAYIPIQSSGKVSIEVGALAAPLASWDQLTDRLAGYGLEAPDRGAFASTHVEEQHGDLHPENVLICNSLPVLIDFDSQCRASKLLDPLTLMLGSIFHKESFLRDDPWPTLDNCANLGSDQFLEGCPRQDYFAKCSEWAAASTTSKREYWGLVLAYVGRQLKYRDVYDVAILRDRCLAIAQTAIEKFD